VEVQSEIIPDNLGNTLRPDQIMLIFESNFVEDASRISEPFQPNRNCLFLRAEFSQGDLGSKIQVENMEPGIFRKLWSVNLRAILY